MNETWENNNIDNQTAEAQEPVAQGVNAEAQEPVVQSVNAEAQEPVVQEVTAEVQEPVVQSVTPEAQEPQYQNPQYQNMGNPYYGQQVYQQQGYPQSPYPNPAYQTPYPNPAYQSYRGYPAGQGQYPYPGYVPTYQKPQKKRSGKFAKFLGVAAAALFFGLLAGGSFIGVNFLYDYLKPEKVEYVQPPVIGQGSTQENAAGTNQIQSSTVVDSEYIQGTSVSDIAERAMPFTVAINCTFTTDSWFGRYETPGSGSGIIVGKNDSELLVVTNNHVIDGANTIKVTLIDDTEADAVVKGTAASTDLAVVAIQLKDLSQETLDAIKIAELGNSNDIKVGEMVVAIGNALGYGQSVTVGYISAKDREVSVDSTTKMTLLQTDAAINPGNSGGALLNLEGEVIGINSVKYADEDVEGMCFAIPVSNVKDIIEGLMNSLAEEEKGYLGVGVNDVTEAIAEYYNWPVGVYVVNFSENSAAEEAGIKIGDIITGVNGVVVETANELIERVTSNRYGTKVTITLQRNVDGEYQELEFDVVLRRSAEFSEQEETENIEQVPEGKIPGRP